MKANSKKLLSLLMAVAMVLSMAPAISLQAEAAEFDATNTICDACGKAPEGGWTEITSTSQISAAGHYYFSSDFEVTAKSGLNFAISSGAACLNLNGVTVDNPTSGSGYRTLSCTAGTLNVMGSGTVKSLNTSKTGAGGAIYAAGGTINLYGGTYTTGNKDTSVFSVLSNGTLNVYNATVTLGTMGASSGADSTVNIYGGTLPCAIRCGSASYGVFNIYGGDFSGSTRGIIYSVGPRSLTITGGTFSADPSSYVPGVSCYSVANNTVSASHTKADGDEGTVIVAGSCTADRMVEYTCSVEGCGAKFTEVIEATGHDFGSNNATCANCGAANPNYVSLPSVCPGCGETVTEWKPVDAATGTSDWNKGNGHFYLTKDLTGGGKRVMQFPADTEVCLHLNGKSITSTCTQSSAITVRSYGTLRLMGEGTISAGENTAAMAAVVPYAGTVEIYGGTYVDSTSNAPVRENGGSIVVYGGNFCDSVSAFVAEGYEQTENADGTFTVTKLDLPTTCPCGAENIEWTELTSAGFSTGITEHKHFYVAKDTTIEGTGNTLQTGASQCIYLMAGTTLTNSGRMRARGGFDIHVFGEGNYVRPDSESEYGMFEGSASNAIYIHGGNWTYSDPDVAVVEGSIIVDGGSFNFDVSSYVADGYVATEENGIWTVAEGTEPEPTDPEPTEPEPTEPEPTEPEPSEPAGPDLPATCPGCGETVTEWKPVTAASSDTGWTTDMNGHYYIANEITGGGKRVFSFPAGTDVCLHLNGQNVTSTATTASAITMRVYGTLRLMGEGTVSSGENTAAMAPVAVYNDANVEIYGGTYTANNGEPVIRIPAGTPTITVYGGTFSTNPGNYVAEGYEAIENEDGTFSVVEKIVDNSCPLCGADEVEWIEYESGAFRSGNNHIRITEALSWSAANTIIEVPEGTTTCLYLEDTLTAAGKALPIAVLGGTLNIGGTADGKITHNGTNKEGLIYINGGTLNVSTVTIENGLSTVVANDNGAVSISGNRFRNRTGNGGNIYLAAGTLNLLSGTVTGGLATGFGNTNSVYTNGGCGGNVFAAAGTTVNITGGTITNGKSTGTGTANMGGNIYSEGTVTVNGGSVTNGEADLNKSKSRGGNIYLKAGTLNLLGGSVTGGKCGNIGGNIEVSGVSFVNLAGNASVTGGEAKSTNDAYLSATTKLTVDAGWTGTATVAIASIEEVRGQALPAENGASTGAYTGKLYWNHTVPTAIYGVDGGLTLAAAAVVTDAGNSWFMSAQEAVDAYNGTGYVLVGTNASIVLTQATPVDNCGNAVAVSGTGNLKAMDSVGNGSWDLTGVEFVREYTNPVTGERYLTIGNETYEFKMKINKVVLRPGTTSQDLGIYYKTIITIGDELAGLIDSYGVALSLHEMPTAQDIMAVGGHAQYTVIDNDLVAGENVVNSGLLNNILKKEYTADDLETIGAATVEEANAIRGELKIYANAYLAVDLDGDGNEEFVMADVEYNGIEHTLKGIMGKVDAMETIPQQAIDCYKAWEPVGMNQWGLTNLAAAAAAEA